MVDTSPHRGDRHTAADWSRRVAIALGSGAHGLADEASVDTWVRIEHQGRAESLNVAMAAALLVFAASDHRSAESGIPERHLGAGRPGPLGKM